MAWRGTRLPPVMGRLPMNAAGAARVDLARAGDNQTMRIEVVRAMWARASAGRSAGSNVLCAAILAALSACSAVAPPGPAAPGETRSASSFALWRQGQAPGVAAFEAHLAAAGLADVVPLHELLRSASDWQPCAAAPYSVPPAAQWPAVLSTLRLLKALRQRGVLGRFEVLSAYRDEALNRCAGGAPRSAHLTAFAVDLVPEDAAAAGERLCRFWREEGAAWQMGLGRYASGRLHIDTWRYRRWGSVASSGRDADAPFCEH